jgi:hypothetical protein
LITGCGPVTDHGFCGVAFGMTAIEAEQVFVLPLIAYEGVEPGDEPPCYLLFPEGRPNDLSFMVVDGEVMRIDVHMPGLRTEAGVGVGSAEEEVLRAYAGRIQIQPHKYDPTVQDAIIGEQNHRLVFQTDGDTVIEYRAGLMPAVGYVELCG